LSGAKEHNQFGGGLPPGQAPDADGEYNYAFKLMERRRPTYIGARCAEHKQMPRLWNNHACSVFSLGRNELRRDGSGVLRWSMVQIHNLREPVEYRGYSLQMTYASPQWQVLIGIVLKDRPTLPTGKQIVKGWNEEETLKRAKSRIDLLIESPSLH
jgi:hypothetical protein